MLDVGCGIGGTSRYLAKKKGCKVTGVTISGRQVEIAKKLTAGEAGRGLEAVHGTEFVKLGDGAVRYIELDAEKMGDFFGSGPNKMTFDCVWISEAMSHLPDKNLFFGNAAALLNPGGKLVVADWFKAEDVTDAQMDADIKPIEGQDSPLHKVSVSSIDRFLQTECSSHRCAVKPTTCKWQRKRVWVCIRSRSTSARRSLRHGKLMSSSFD